MANCTFERRAALLFIDRMLGALSERQMMRSELETELHASKTKVLNYLRLLHGDTGQSKRIYICGYVQSDNGGRTPKYAVGNRPDAKPLGSRTDSERWKLIKADEDKHRRYLAKLRAKAAIKRSIKKPITWASALGL